MTAQELNDKLAELGADPRGFLSLSEQFSRLAMISGHSPATMVAAAQACIEVAADSEREAGKTHAIVAAVADGHATFRAERLAKSS